MSEAPLGINLHVEGAIATITLNQPQRHNSLDGDDIAQLQQHLQTIAADKAVRVLIITGSGDRSFCSGAALDQLGSGSISGELFAEMNDRIADVAVPTICALNGSAYGGGSEIGLACDFRIGVEGMRVFVPPARIGLCYPVNGIRRFVSVLGIHTAKRLLLASEEFNAEQLLGIGYLTQLVKPDQLQAATQQLAQRLAGYAPLALQAMKAISDRAAGETLDLETANQLAAACNRSADLQEGFLARQEKRPPVFRGE
ncbi:enoyl-CoA hydratase/isomerase family protein [Pseudomaricurvus sp. HS19]|uniref:enoyl-CoA hydratase/isomerase family protein n=1 Tax=Pseudomaricurvus sp. HS19 TaxID=2692626 RepID=UPI00136B52FD|nr:enoyl-CoA hydratase/isomerase family protein [Pseudomaricurvus sp. HS19]MYM64678.1 enoyl-CoA hydratase/isomerase family protein [Pseudomaricurvus sp. HS19]